MIRVKICGITNIDDALAACSFGADALGFVFAESPRRIEEKAASFIAGCLPPFVQTVGVFVNEAPAEVEQIVSSCRLNAVQFHGRETPECCDFFRRAGIKVLKTFRVSGAEDLAPLEPYKGAVSAFLLDTFCPGLAGGTGKTFDWTVAARAAGFGLPIILAGGLRPENVREAIQIAQPYALDVSSGIEASPGKKDHARMRLFIENAKKWG